MDWNGDRGYRDATVRVWLVKLGMQACLGIRGSVRRFGRSGWLHVYTINI